VFAVSGTNAPVGNLWPHHYFIRPRRQRKLRASLLIQFQSRGNIQVSNRNFACPRSVAPIVRVGVYDPAHNYVLSDFFLVSVVKHEHGSRKFARRVGCLGRARASRWRRRWLIRRALQFRRGGLLTILQFRIGCKSHPPITLQFEHKPWSGLWRRRHRLIRSLNDLLRRRIAHPRFGIVVRKVRNITRTIGKPPRLVSADEPCSRATMS